MYKGFLETRGNWMGCWNLIILLSALSVRFSSGTEPLLRPFLRSVRRGEPAPLVPYYITQSPVFTGLCRLQAGSFLNYRKEPDYSVSGSFLLSGAGYCR